MYVDVGGETICGTIRAEIHDSYVHTLVFIHIGIVYICVCAHHIQLQ